jgi:D-alanyl-D-alanine carboxypeptidase
MDRGFADYKVQQLIRRGQVLGTLPVVSGEATQVELIATEDFSYPLAQGEKPEIRFSRQGFVYAPVVRGQDAGVAYVCLSGKAVGKIPVLYGQTVETETVKKPSLWEKLLKGGRK